MQTHHRYVKHLGHRKTPARFFKLYCLCLFACENIHANSYNMLGHHAHYHKGLLYVSE